MNDSKRFMAVFGGGLALVAALFLLSLFTGPVAIGFGAGWRALFTTTDLTPIMWEIRLPRALGAVLVGGSLGLAGAALQGYMRNPLAEPGLVGVTGAASLGAVVAIYSGWAMAFSLALPLGALAAAMLAVVLVLVLAGRGRDPVTLILAGVAISSLCGALTTLLISLSNPYAMAEIIFWLLGSLHDLSMPQIYLGLPFIFAGWLLLLALGRMLNLLTLGHDAAASMGISLVRLRLCLVIGAGLCVGASTALAGAIGFIGLMAPHIMRPPVRAVPARLLPVSAVAGAVLVLLADIAVRALAPWQDLKLGVLTALIGAPFFLWLVIRSRREGW
ncbi:MAG: FecCD transport family protein [Candidatus Tokpelaia hoelldobleri]|uniref:FecCD transport family protein n=1 Tax=Candidatus Tokpelaia hoelldobleri TaxID=1902579 RepID=A0A1U9JW77_9HYPH|nr:MAG: FecCD transport family protein [Candidatus Tokpelaia hoelldoblerii]